MATVSLPGLSTGIDTASLISQLVQAEAKNLTAMQEKLATYKDKKTAVTELESKLSTFKTALNNLHSLSKLKAFDTSTSDDEIVTATASSSATEGSHTVQVKQLASADRLVSEGGGYSSSSAIVSESGGVMIISYGGQQFSVTLGANATLTELMNAINNSSDNPGVTASLLEYDSGTTNWHLVLAGDDTGADYQIEILDQTRQEYSSEQLILRSGGDEATKSTKISSLANYYDTKTITISGVITDSETSETTNVSKELTVTSYTTVDDLIDAIEDAYGGAVSVYMEDGQIFVTSTSDDTFTVNLEFVDSESQSTSLTMTQTIASGEQTASLSAFDSFTQTKEAQDALVKVDGYPQDIEDGEGNVTEEKWISRETNSISDIIAGVTVNLLATSENDTGGYDEISISLNRNTETVKENLTSLIEAYNAIVTYIDENTEYDDENKKMGVLSDMYSIKSISDIITSPLRSVATGFTSSDTFTMPQDIGLEIDADGTLELDEDTFDEAIAEDYMAVMNLLGAESVGSTVGGDSAYISFYGANSYTDAGNYDVKVTTVDGEVTEAWIKLKTESTWREMTIAEDGMTLYGDNTCDSNGNPLYPEYSLVLTIDTASKPDASMTTTLNIKQGFGDNLYDLLTEMLESDGRIDVAQDSLDDQIEMQNDKIDDETDRLEAYQTRLEAKFARLEATLSELQNKLSTITAMS